MAESKIDDIQKRMMEKAGPLPVWGWVVIVLAGYYYYSKKKAAANAATNGQTSTTSTKQMSSQDLANAYQAGLIQADYSLQDQLGYTQSSLANLGTNVGLQTTATQANTGALNSNTGAVTDNTGAVNSNTGAVNTNTSATNTNTVAVSQPVIQRVVAAPPPPPPPPPSQVTYTVKPGDNLFNIGKSYGVAWQNIYAANRGLIGSNPGLIHPGQNLVIPK
jgi:LysM repeat protein